MPQLLVGNVCVWVVIDADGVEVKYQMVDTEEGGLDGDDEGEVGVRRR